jgi:hypothetical protein
MKKGQKTKKTEECEKRVPSILKKKGCCCTAFQISKSIKQNYSRVRSVLRDLHKRKIVGIVKSKGWTKDGKYKLKVYWGLK